MTDKDMTRLVNVLSEETDYDTIIFDIGYLGESSLSLMKMCDKLILPKVENGVPVYSFAKEGGDYLKKSWDYSHSYGQCWGIQLGVKYFFN